MLFVSVTAHLLYELVCTYICYLEEGPATMHRSSRLPCILYFTSWKHFSGMCLFGFFLFFFPQRGFWRGFFPWTCWPHVLNKSVLCWLIPVNWNVCFCVIWSCCFILLCSPFPFLHVLPFLHVAISARCHFCTLPNPSISARCPIPFIKMQWIVC